jgi:patatin-related protein
MADNNVGTADAAGAGSADVLDEYDAEVRFGVVMYGGVSLAIYINGVANEMYELACATPRDGPSKDAPPTGTRRVYQRLSRLLSEPALRKPYLDRVADPSREDPLAVRTAAVNRTRFIVDVIAGTSAGGINGIFLAKALANGESFGGLKKLWIEEGDIGSLLNDRHSFEGLAPLAAKGAPRSLLNSERMYLKLYDAMAGLTPVDALRGPSRAPGGGTVSRVAERLDLYITTTDIRGSTVPLRLFDRVVQEKRYKQVYHLEYANEGAKNDFAADNVPFLAFTARCTSSFPFAFEPMQLCVVGDVLNRSGKLVLNDAQWAERYAEWRHHFRGLEPEQLEAGRHVTLAFGDGGYLDNKPFSYAVEALSWRHSA